jgi:hypothetical protein
MVAFSPTEEEFRRKLQNDSVMSKKQQQQISDANRIHSHALVMQKFREPFICSTNTIGMPAAYQVLFWSWWNQW